LGPIPRAKANTATAAKPLFFASNRRPKQTSRQSVSICFLYEPPARWLETIIGLTGKIEQSAPTRSRLMSFGTRGEVQMAADVAIKAQLTICIINNLAVGVRIRPTPFGPKTQSLAFSPFPELGQRTRQFGLGKLGRCRGAARSDAVITGRFPIR